MQFRFNRLISLLILCCSITFCLATSAVAAPLTPIQNSADFFITTNGAWPSGGTTGSFTPINNDGTFGVQTDTSALAGNHGIDAADMDGDGDNDILLKRRNDIYLLRNDGAGNYQEEVIVTQLLFHSTYLRITDFNNDGRNDFVIGDIFLNYGIHIYLQDALGNFTKQNPGLDLGTLHPDGRTSIIGLAAGDVNNDGNADIIALGYFGRAFNYAYLYLGDGTGKMSAQSEIICMRYDVNGIRVRAATALALFDFEGDGDLDMAIGGSQQSDIPDFYVFTNDGAGNFAIPTEPAFLINGAGNWVMDNCDFDRDGDGDLIIANTSNKTIYYAENLGGEFADPVVVGYTENRQSGIGASPAGTLTQTAEEQLEALIEGVTTIPELTFSNTNQANALENKLSAILVDLNLIDENTPEADKLAIYQNVLNKLNNDILSKTDGFYGGKLKNDWVTTQEGQDYLYPKVIAVIEAIQKEIDALTGV